MSTFPIPCFPTNQNLNFDVISQQIKKLNFEVHSICPPDTGYLVTYSQSIGTKYKEIQSSAGIVIPSSLRTWQFAFFASDLGLSFINDFFGDFINRFHEHLTIFLHFFLHFFIPDKILS